MCALQVLCKLIMEPFSTVSAFHQYPIYFDCCIQVLFSIAAFHIDPKDWTTFVPAGFDSFRIYKRIDAGTQLYCHSTIISGDWQAKQIKGRLRLIDAAGVVYAEAINFTVAKAGKAAIRSAAGVVGAELWNTQWKPSELDTSVDSTAGSALLFVSSTGHPQVSEVSKQLGGVTVRAGSSYSVQGGSATIDPADPTHYTRLFAEPMVEACDNVVFAWSLDHKASVPSAAGMAHVQQLLYLSQAMVDTSLASDPRLWVVTSSAAQDDTSDVASVSQASAWCDHLRSQMHHPRAGWSNHFQ